MCIKLWRLSLPVGNWTNYMPLFVQCQNVQFAGWGKSEHYQIYKMFLTCPPNEIWNKKHIYRIASHHNLAQKQRKLTTNWSQEQICYWWMWTSLFFSWWHTLFICQWMSHCIVCNCTPVACLNHLYLVWILIYYFLP